MTAYIVLATEDELSEAVGRRLIEESAPVFKVVDSLRKNGNGYLKNRAHNFCQMAHHKPVFLITDLDNAECAPSLITSWLGTHQLPDTFLFRVAVREVESWLLADQVGIRALLGKGAARLPAYPDREKDPKRTLLALAQNAPRPIREDLLPEKGAVASKGFGYNRRLCAFVRDSWSPARAAEKSESLMRTRLRLRELSLRLTN